MSEWISVKDRLPKSGKTVLLFCVYDGLLKYQITGSYHKNNKSWYSLDWSGMGEYLIPSLKNLEITHWMPLPDKPKTGGER